MIACVGNDTFGNMAFDVWRREGIDIRHVVRRDGVSTGGSIVVIGPNGDNYLVVDPAANEHLTGEDVRRIEGEIARSAVVMAQLEIQPEAVREGLRLGRHVDRFLLDGPGVRE